VQYKKRFDQINVIPFIDILLVLLVMVITTATFVKQGILPIELPDANASVKKENTPKEYSVSINRDGEYFLDDKAIALSELKAALSKISKKSVVVLRSDKEARFQDFVAVMDILKALKHEELYIVTKH